jgi:hypothetical protein
LEWVTIGKNAEKKVEKKAGERSRKNTQEKVEKNARGGNRA